MTEVQQATKPLSAAQQRNLAKLIDNDFNQLRANLDQEYTVRRSALNRELQDARTAGIVPDDEMPGYLGTRLGEIRELINVLVNDLQHDGIVPLHNEGIRLTVPTQWRYSKAPGRKVGEISADIDALDSLVHLKRYDIETMRHTAQREVLMSTILPTGKSAQELLESIPTAADLLAIES